MFRRDLLAAFPLVVCLSGCGDAGTSGDGAYGSDRAVAEEELARVSQALGEASCGSTAADATLLPNQSLRSPDGSYDHPTCRNAFVVDVPGVIAGTQLWGGRPPLVWLDPFTCLLVWGYSSLWQKQATGYVKISEGSRLGTWAPTPRTGFVCSAPVTLRAPADGDYKLVTAAGVLFGPNSLVEVAAQDP
jgi:hypothetical protein